MLGYPREDTSYILPNFLFDLDFKVTGVKVCHQHNFLTKLACYLTAEALELKCYMHVPLGDSHWLLISLCLVLFWKDTWPIPHNLSLRYFFSVFTRLRLHGVVNWKLLESSNKLIWTFSCHWICAREKHTVYNRQIHGYGVTGHCGIGHFWYPHDQPLIEVLIVFKVTEA